MLTPTPMSCDQSVREQLQSTMQYQKSVHSDVTNSRRYLDELEASRASTHKDLLGASRNKYILEQQKARDGQDELSSTREDYTSAIKEEEESVKVIEVEIEDINNQVQQMRETSNDAQKRLTIVRLMSMLDELQNSLQDKVDGTTEEEEERPQELLKIIQELTRSRERTLSLVNKREREMKAIIELKKARAAELEVEADKNRDMLDQVNNDEILSVAQRIQKERRELIMQLKKEEEINNKLADTMKDVKYAAEKYPKDRNAALSADEARGTSANPEKEMAELRKRITAADAERRRLTLKTQEMKTRTEDGAADYTEQMTQLKREILTYQTECTRLEKENRDLQNLCDSIGQTLQN